jgi:Tfp pilus assembly protein PilZ
MPVQRGVGMADFERQLQQYSSIARLFGLITSLPQEQFLTIVKQLLGDHFTRLLFKMVIELPEEQQRQLLQRLEGMQLEGGRIEKRGHRRKSCLVGVGYSVKGRRYNSFILDISAFGVFIETREYFPVGAEIKMTFTIPDQKAPFQLSGEIVWSGMQGMGVKFRYLTQHQLETIRTFAEKIEEIYEIIS